MRREGYEFAVSKAEVLYHYDENGKKLEPMELAYVDVPDEFTGAVISKLQQRKGELLNMGSIAGGKYVCTGMIADTDAFSSETYDRSHILFLSCVPVHCS